MTYFNIDSNQSLCMSICVLFTVLALVLKICIFINHEPRLSYFELGKQDLVSTLTPIFCTQKTFDIQRLLYPQTFPYHVEIPIESTIVKSNLLDNDYMAWYQRGLPQLIGMTFGHYARLNLFVKDVDISAQKKILYIC